MTTWALIPAKAPGEGKSRLAAALAEHEREALVEAMFRHVVAVATNCPAIARTVVVGPMRHRLDAEILFLDEPGGLNGALGSALSLIAGSEYAPDRVVVVPADLPCLAAADLDRLAALTGPLVAIAPDRHGSGTNGLSLPLPEAASFRFRFGSDSAARHRREAEMLGLTVETILREGLAKDIDEPSDLVDAEAVCQIRTRHSETS